MTYNLTILFSSISIAGHVIVTYACFIGTENQNDDWPYYVAFGGRFVYGLGGEILSVCQHTIVSRWFMESELSFAIAIMMSITWAGGHTIVSRWFMESELSFAIAIMMSITWAGGVFRKFHSPPLPPGEGGVPEILS